jgi:hypothetical protein
MVAWRKAIMGQNFTQARGKRQTHFCECRKRGTLLRVRRSVDEMTQWCWSSGDLGGRAQGTPETAGNDSE